MIGFEILSHTWWKLSFRLFASVGSDGNTDFILPLKGLISFHQSTCERVNCLLKFLFLIIIFIQFFCMKLSSLSVPANQRRWRSAMSALMFLPLVGSSFIWWSLKELDNDVVFAPFKSELLFFELELSFDWFIIFYHKKEVII